MGALALAIPAPAVKGAFNTVADDFGPLARVLADTIPEMGAHVRAERVNHFCLTIFCPKRHQLLPEVMQGNGVAGRKFRGVQHLKPAEGHGQGATWGISRYHGRHFH